MTTEAEMKQLHSRPSQLSGPAWEPFRDIFEPCSIAWDTINDKLIEIWVGRHRVGWMQNRPHYCDRGHVVVTIDLPYLDDADGFPRYYMNRAAAISETEAFLKWRLWRIDNATESS